jgi:hypothetical protein
MVVLLGVAACGGTSSNGSGGGSAGTGGSAGAGGGAGTGGTDVQPPVDQCVNDADQAIFDELGAGAVGEIVSGCAFSACGGPAGAVLGGDTSDRAAKALADCIAECGADRAGLSTECANCYGLITTCTIGGPCLAPCAADPGSAECATCSTEACGFLDACLGI